MQESLHGPALERALNRRLRELDPRLRRWADDACRAHGDRGLSHADDVANRMRWECARVLRRALTAGEASASPHDAAVGEPAAEPGPTPALLRRIALRAADRYFHSSAATGFSGATGAARRASRSRLMAAQLTATLGRTPTAHEVVDAVNAAARAARADPIRQGALIRDARDHYAAPVPLDEAIASPVAVADDVHARLTAELAVHRTIEVCRAMSAALGETAEAWLGGSLADPPVIPTVAELAALSSRRPDEVRELLDECRIVAELVCLELGLRPD
jgi:hypothetical protein